MNVFMIYSYRDFDIYLGSIAIIKWHFFVNGDTVEFQIRSLTRIVVTECFVITFV